MATSSDDKRQRALHVLADTLKDLKKSGLEASFILGSSLLLNPFDRLRTIKQTNGMLNYYDVPTQSSYLTNLQSNQFLFSYFEDRGNNRAI
jgi:hypothetical protein